MVNVMNNYSYKDNNGILIVKDKKIINNKHIYKVSVKDKYRGIIYYDNVSNVWSLAYGKTLRGRYFFFRSFDNSIEYIVDTIRSIYHIGQYELGAKIR